MRNRKDYRNWQGNDWRESERDNSRIEQGRDPSQASNEFAREDRAFKNDSENFESWDDGRIQFDTRRADTRGPRYPLDRDPYGNREPSSLNPPSGQRGSWLSSIDWRGRDLGGMGYTGAGDWQTRSLFGNPTPNAGPHSGKGPKGYLRSDDRIKDEVCEVLSRHALIDASEIEVEVKNGEVILSGSVEERAMKRLAEDAIEYLAGVKDVRNQLRIQARSAGQNLIGKTETTDATDRPNTGRTKNPIHA